MTLQETKKLMKGYTIQGNLLLIAHCTLFVSVAVAHLEQLRWKISLEASSYLAFGAAATSTGLNLVSLFILSLSVCSKKPCKSNVLKTKKFQVRTRGARKETARIVQQPHLSHDLIQA